KGELVSADFIHRTGQFRMSPTGEMVDFTLPPFGAIHYLGAEADLRDLPLGTCFQFLLYQDSGSRFTRVAAMQDQFSIDAADGVSYRIEELKLADHKLVTAKQNVLKKQSDLGKKELLVTGATRVWKGDKQIQLAELAVGDELLVNLTPEMPNSTGHCTDI